MSFFSFLSLVTGVDAGKTTKFDFALYFAPAPATDPEALLASLLENEFADAKHKMSVESRWEKTEDYQPPDPKSFRYVAVDLQKEDGAKIAESDRVFVLSFSAADEKLVNANLLANKLISALAEKTGGCPWDEECRLLYSAKAWREKRVESWQGELPDVRGHVNMHAYRDPELVRIITLGMRKFGQPDLVLTDMPSGNSGTAGNLINACAQRLLEGQAVANEGLTLKLSEIKHDAMRKMAMSNPKKGATGRVDLKFRAIKGDEGDPANRIWLLEFPGFEGKTTTERELLALSSIYGASDEVSGVQKGDAKMRQASERARKAFLEKVPSLRKGFAPNERLLVKAPFQIGDEREYMWVEATSWGDDSLKGILANDSIYDKSLKHGVQVTISFADVYDYIHYKPDGSEEGNETGKVLKELEGD